MKLFSRRLRCKRNRRDRKLAYGNLESRVMLSADLDAARNLVDNGSFEAATTAPFVAFADGDIANLQPIRLVTLTTSHSRVAELDSLAGLRESIVQDVITETGADYIVSFDLRGRPVEIGDSADTNEVQVLFDGSSVGVFTGIERWQTFNIAVTATSSLSRLEFRETLTVSDGKGILLDHIALAGVRETGIVNGSFEIVNGESTSEPVTRDRLPGFFAVPNNDSIPIGVEMIGNATDGDHVFRVNTSNSRLDRVFQNIRSEAGSNYFVTFDLRNAGGSEAATNLRLRWNNQFAGSFFGTAQWQRHGVVLGSTSSYSTLVWREAVANTGAGPEVDNIRLFRIDSLPTDFELDLNGSLPGTGHQLNYVENSQVRITTGDMTLRFNNGNILSSATVRILEYDRTQRLLATTAGTRIRSEFNTADGILRLVGRDSVGNYQRLLRSLMFTDSSDDPTAGPLRISVSVTDGTASSIRHLVELNVIPVNDAPRVTPIPDFPLLQNDPLTINVGAIDPDDTNLTFNISIAGDVEIFGSSLPTISNIGQIQLNAVTHGSSDITVSVRDPAGLGSEFTFTVTAPFV